jgi:uncharacterized membrane-anchored protein YjiN (DUF445 family)
MKPQSLPAMKWFATALLFGAAVVYAVAAALRSRHPAWGYVAAFSEAAMVGAVADWFAVSALFRHPLGIPIPHTAVIPRNKDRIGHNLATFICTHFLTTAQVLAKLQRWDVPQRLSKWLAHTDNAQQLARHLGHTVLRTLGTVEAQPVRQFFVATVVQRLAKLDLTHVAGQALQMLTSGQHHTRLLSDVLQHLSVVLDDDVLKEKMADVVADEVKYLRFVGLDAVAGRYATSKIVAGIVKLVTDMGQDPEHSLRLRFNRFMLAFADRLQSDDALKGQGETIKQELLAHPQFAQYLHTLWSEMVNWTRHDLGQESSLLQERIASAVQHLAQQLTTDTAMQQWLNQQLLHTVSALTEPVRCGVHHYIVARVAQWNAVDMAQELENNIGRDLQFIRINGTLVGGLAGLLIYSLTEIFRAL